MDTLDAFIYNLHKMLGHDVTARYLNQDAGDKTQCHLCHPELCEDTCRAAHHAR